MNNKITKISGYIPFLIIIFLNAFVDLGHKIIIQNTVFKAFEGSEQIILSGVINALILIPFLFLFSTAGFLSDRFDKTKIIKLSSISAVAITLLITFCYYNGYFWGAFGLTLVLAIQSAIYSPAKYAYIKELVGKEHLSLANSAAQGFTTVAILFGIAVFSFLFESLSGSSSVPLEIFNNIESLGWILVSLSTIEAILAFRLPSKNSGNKEASFNKKKLIKLVYLKENTSALYKNGVVWLCIVGLAIFWSISQVMLSVFPSYAKDAYSENNIMVIQGILALSGFGIVIGSWITAKFSKNYIETGLIPLGAIGVAITTLLIPMMNSITHVAPVFFLMGVFGSIFIIPLNSLIQFNTTEKDSGTVLAGNNFIQTVFMMAFLVVTITTAYLNISSSYILYTMAVIATCGALYTVIKLPQSMVRFIVTLGFSQRYRMKVDGFKNIPSEGGVLLLGNHISWIDWAIVQMSCPRQIRFVMERRIYNKWYLQPFLKFFGVLPVSSGGSKSSLQEVTRYLNDGEVVCIFPEGAISRNGQMGEFHRGYTLAAKNANNAVILPFYLRGLWGSSLSRSSSKLKRNRKPISKREVIVAYGEPMAITSKPDEVKQKVFELSFSSWSQYTNTLEPIHVAWLNKVKSSKGSQLSIADYAMNTEINNLQLLTGVRLFAKRISKISEKEQNIGILLPTSAAGIITNLAVLSLGKTTVNINYTTSMESVDASLSRAEICSIYTSRKFIKKLKARGIDVEPILSKRNVVYLEDLKEQISTKEKVLTMFFAKILPADLIEALWFKKVELDSPAAIMFSSGSEGVPKGVVLSHRNIAANIKQISDVLNTNDQDVVMNSLPLFHSFGYTVTSLMPMIEGMPVVCYPDPTDAPSIGKAVAKYNATILCATSTFLRLYTKNRKLLPQMFDSLRVVVGGAEKVNNDVRFAFESKFKKTIYEGYGATETTPVASVCLPDHLDKKYWTVQKGFKTGTVGMPIPGTAFKIVDPETLCELPTGEDGLILIGGCQIMLGYLNDQAKTDEVIVEIDGMRWYKTGDKGHLDADRFLTIVDRYSRFAKLGGEMISLGAVEEEVKKHIDIDKVGVIAVNLPDAKKGEKVVMIFSGDITESRMRKIISESAMPPIMKPTEIYYVDNLPVLGSGKVDFKGAALLAKEQSK